MINSKPCNDIPWKLSSVAAEKKCEWDFPMLAIDKRECIEEPSEVSVYIIRESIEKSLKVSDRSCPQIRGGHLNDIFRSESCDLVAPVRRAPSWDT